MRALLDRYSAVAAAGAGPSSTTAREVAADLEALDGHYRGLLKAEQVRAPL